MDDANLNENINEHTQAVDNLDRVNTAQDGFKNDQIHLDPSRWWFASAAFPMIAGTLGPVASAFSICSLVRYWRQHIPPGSDVTRAVFVEDPPWLLAINAVQLVLALVANVFLLLNMTKRVRFSIAQPVTITGWYLSAICLIALCATASGPLDLQPQIEYVWSQAFYYGMYAAILYFIVASLMVVTVWGAERGHYGKDFELTTSQRTLMLQTILFLMYLLLGALVFSKIEGWNYLDSVYWADVTLFTVGFGEISPQTSLGRGLLVPYALIGVISLGLVIGSIRSMILDRGKHRLDARMLERERRQLIRRMVRKGKGGILEPVNDNASENFPPGSGLTEFERRKKEFQLMRKVQRQRTAKKLLHAFQDKLTCSRASKRERWTAMSVSTSTWVLLWLVGAKIFQECEYPYQGWSYFDGFYFAFTALTTVGYGDLTPVSNSAKAFFVFWSLLALPTTTVLISHAGDTIVKGVKDGTLLLGNITILPGEYGFKKEIKRVLAKMSCGVLFMDDEEVEETAPGFLGAANERPDTDEEKEDEDGASRSSDANNVESNRRAEKDAEKGGSDSTSPLAGNKTTKRGTDELETASKATSSRAALSKSLSRSVSIPREDIPTELPKTRAEYHLILIDEISRVTKHLRHSPPRKYTFKEWAWYLSLIGEDESSASNHRRPERRPPDGHGRRSHKLGAKKKKKKKNKSASESDEENGAGKVAEAGGQQRPKWSWVGHRSPLMDTREEAEWILDKLEQRLREELQAVVREGGVGAGAGAGAEAGVDPGPGPGAGAGAGRDALRQVEEEERLNEQRKDPGTS